MRGRLWGVVAGAESLARSGEGNDALAADAGGVALVFRQSGEQSGGHRHVEAPAASDGGGGVAAVGALAEWAGGL